MLATAVHPPRPGHAFAGMVYEARVNTAKRNCGSTTPFAEPSQPWRDD
ncbi:MAG: hypothetical protein AVDCRST_MAG71-298 [uncultured Lysobacter sp.]|uniref:Uncharacterized protein n=1 Tax=uncultured Lysobacter sp. TaxID=271060 RepID=A0A6J4KF89_9GAMM|nr:MAG: hypothetical protein AVDCRST_MAG71-298 [uncultured Lysobacter sp.]